MAVMVAAGETSRLLLELEIQIRTLSSVFIGAA
jgi:hypothetical protein